MAHELTDEQLIALEDAASRFVQARTELLKRLPPAEYQQWLRAAQETQEALIAAVDALRAGEPDRQYDSTEPPIEEVIAGIGAQVPAEEWAKLPPTLSRGPEWHMEQLAEALDLLCRAHGWSDPFYEDKTLWGDIHALLARHGRGTAAQEADDGD